MLFLSFKGMTMDIFSIIQQALNEDIGTGDVTTEYLQLDNEETQAFLVAKQEGIIAGLEIAFDVFAYLDNQVNCVTYRKDGDTVKPGDEIAKVTGLTSALLQAERTALNILQRLSGIATLTHKYVKAIEPYEARLLDTRKTTPLLRQLERYAVRVGGGFNHRFGLYDMVLIKENHIRAAGSITEAVNRVLDHNTAYRIEVEVTNLKELDEAVACGVDRVMLDNMTVAMMKKAVKKHGNKVELEASGNVRLDTINEIASTGVHYISSGALTHSYQSLDISMLFKE